MSAKIGTRQMDDFVVGASKIITASDYTWRQMDFQEAATVSIAGGDGYQPSYEAARSVMKLLGVPPGIVAAGVSVETMMTIVNDLHRKIDVPVYVKVGGNGIVHSVVVSDGSPIDPVSVLSEMINLANAGRLPQMYIEDYSANGSMHMRIVAPEAWNFTVGDDDPYYGAATIDVSPHGGLNVATAVQRLACYNYQIGDYVAKDVTSVQSRDQLGEVIATSFDRVSQAALAMRDRLVDMKAITVKYPNKMLAQVIKSIGLTGKSAVEANDYFVANTEMRTMYDVVQAVTHGTKALVSKKAGFTTRTRKERLVWDVMTGVVKMVNDGDAPEDFYLDDATAVRDRIINMIKSKADKYDGEPAQALLDTAHEVEVVVV